MKGGIKIEGRSTSTKKSIDSFGNRFFLFPLAYQRVTQIPPHYLRMTPNFQIPNKSQIQNLPPSALGFPRLPAASRGFAARRAPRGERDGPRGERDGPRGERGLAAKRLAMTKTFGIWYLNCVPHSLTDLRVKVPSGSLMSERTCSR